MAKGKAAKSNHQAGKVAHGGGKRDSARLLHAPSGNISRKRAKQSNGAIAMPSGGNHAKKPSSAVDAARAYGLAGDAMMSGLSIMEKSLQQKARKGCAASALASLASSTPSSAAAPARKWGGLQRAAAGYKSTGCDPPLQGLGQDAPSSQEASIYSLSRHGPGRAVPRASRGPLLPDDTPLQDMARHLQGSQRRRLHAVNTATASGTAAANGVSQQQRSSSGQRFGRSIITDRLLRPTQAGDVDNVNLPWSCAIYSVVNWMVAFADVEGIQVSSIDDLALIFA